MLKPKAELALRDVGEPTTDAELKLGEAKGGVESRTKQMGGGISGGYGACERTVGAITCTMLRLRRLKLLLCTTSGAYAITVTLDDQFAEAKAH